MAKRTLMAFVLALAAAMGQASLAHAGTAEVSGPSGVRLVVSVLGGYDAGPGYAGVVQDTRVGGTLYVSTRPSAFNVVRARVSAPAGWEGLQLAVQNTRTGVATRLPLARSGSAGTVGGVEHAWHEATFPITELSSAVPAARDGDELRLTVEGVAGVSVTLVVDSTPPRIVGLSPEDGAALAVDRVTLSGAMVDDGSGMRSDTACASGAGGPGCRSDVPPFAAVSAAHVDADLDGLTSGEPRQLVNGRAADIRLWVAQEVRESGFHQWEQDFSWQARWSRVEQGYQFTLTPRLELAGATAYEWVIRARDRAGNVASARVRFTLDQATPVLERVETGLGYDSATGAEVESARWLKAVFGNEGSPLAEALDPATVEASDFRVSDGHSVEEAVHVVDETGRSVVYLRLARSLGPDETPVVTLAGEVRDLAGNGSRVQDVRAVDRIRPVLSVVIEGEPGVEGRPVARGTPGHELRVLVRADGPLAEAPQARIHRYAYDSREGAEALRVRTVLPLALEPVAGEAHAWEGRISLQDAAGPGLLGVFVAGEDGAGNAGWSGDGGLDADGRLLTTAAMLSVPAGSDVGIVDLRRAHLAEVDDGVGLSALPSLSPGDGDRTESRRPLVALAFDEAEEWAVPVGGRSWPATATTTANVLYCGDVGRGVGRCSASRDAFPAGTRVQEVPMDAHGQVRVAATDADSATPLAARAESDGSVLIDAGVRGVGQHRIVFEAYDVAGNRLAYTYAFEVVEPPPFVLDLAPGWNLVSFPQTPAAPALGDVFGEAGPVVTVMTFRAGQWEVAALGPDGRWDGTLREVSASAAYWVESTGFARLEVRLRPPDLSVPVVSVRAGWNLVPVLRPSSQSLRVSEGPLALRDYLASVDWTVAYGYDTLDARWQRLTPSTNATAEAGGAYWVWANADGVLAP